MLVARHGVGPVVRELRVKPLVDGRDQLGSLREVFDLSTVGHVGVKDPGPWHKFGTLAASKRRRVPLSGAGKYLIARVPGCVGLCWF